MSGELFTSWQEARDRSVEVARKDRVRPLTENQGNFLKAIDRSVVTICVGPAGTGKTYLACAEAARALRDGRCQKIVVCRPMVTCSGRQGKGIGFLPGDAREKVTPFMRPLLDAFGEFFSPAQLRKHLDSNTIEMLPLDLMRGMSVKNAYVLLDEAQNAEFEQLYMLLTRFDKNTKVVLTGDDSRRQNDLKGAEFALAEVVRRFTARRHKDISVVRLTRKDIVRHPLIQFIDEVMAGDPGPEAWFEVRCHACKSRLWYEDPDEEVDQVKCFACGGVTELWTEDDYYQPRPAVDVVDPNDTYPEKP